MPLPTHTYHLPSPPWLRRLQPTEKSRQYCLRMLRVRCPRQEEEVRSLLGFTSVRVNPWSVRVINCLSFHAVIAPRPKWEMCIKLFLCSRLLAVLCVLIYVFPHSLPAALVLHLGQVQRSVELPQLALLLWDLGTTAIHPFVPLPNMATNTLLGVSPTLPHLGPSHMS